MVKDSKGNRCTEPGTFEVEAQKSEGRGPSYISVIANLEASIGNIGRHPVIIFVDGKEIHRTHFTVQAAQAR